MPGEQCDSVEDSSLSMVKRCNFVHLESSAAAYTHGVFFPCTFISCCCCINTAFFCILVEPISSSRSGLHESLLQLLFSHSGLHESWLQLLFFFLAQNFGSSNCLLIFSFCCSYRKWSSSLLHPPTSCNNKLHSCTYLLSSGKNNTSMDFINITKHTDFNNFSNCHRLLDSIQKSNCFPLLMMAVMIMMRM